MTMSEPLALQDLISTLGNPAKNEHIDSLRSLNLSGLGLTGPLQPAPPSLGLAAFPDLQVLDLSNNQEITGTLPDIFAGWWRWLFVIYYVFVIAHALLNSHYFQ
jgi:hypothetical protein